MEALSAIMQAGVRETKSLVAVYGPRTLDSAKVFVTTELPNHLTTVSIASSDNSRVETTTDPSKAKDWSSRNPSSAVLAVLSVTLVTTSGSISLPILSTLGFTANGVGAGESIYTSYAADY